MMPLYSLTREFTKGFGSWMVRNDEGSFVNDFDSKQKALRYVFETLNGDIFYDSMETIQSAAFAVGSHFFDAKTLEFWKSIIAKSNYGNYFVTSERNFTDSGRHYTVREIRQGHVRNAKEFQSFADRDAAHKAARDLYNADALTRAN